MIRRTMIRRTTIRIACAPSPRSRAGAGANRATTDRVVAHRCFVGAPRVIALAVAIILAAAAATTMMTGCAATSAREGLDVAQLPVDVRPDYALFAHRCSKCHSLSRALNSSIAEDSMWIDYVNRMRRQPGSGIAPQDTAPILRFLHYYSLEQRRRKLARETVSQARNASPTDAIVAPGPDPRPDR